MNAQSPDIGASVSLAALTADPYPTYARLRAEAPVCFLPVANRYLVTRFADISTLERDPETFSSNETPSLMKRVMGHTMLRKDGAAHRRERAACEAALRPGVVRDHWTAVFQHIVDNLIDEMIKQGDAADLMDSFAAPCASLSLAAMLGLVETPWRDLANWSQALMDGTGNYGDDADIWRRSEAAAEAIDAAIDEVVPHLTRNPDKSIISAMIHAADPLSRAEISANVKVIIGGGLNEPRDAIGAAVVALLENPEQRALVRETPSLWRNVFEETVRWVSPIGMYPRQTTREVELGGVTLEKGARIGVMLAAANRDEAVFDNPDVFDITRERRSHLAFGAGAHFCLGAWASRVQVGEIALPTLFRRLPSLRAGDRPATWAGWVFRGPTSVPVAWTN